MKYIIDPTSTEWNRGSFCYLPYLYYDHLKWGEGEEITFLENYTIRDRDKIDMAEVGPEGDGLYVAFWSPTQTNQCIELHRTFKNAKFFGYNGFIEELGLPILKITPDEIISGMKHQGKSFEKLQSVLLSDCDSHLQGKYKGQWYPFYSMYGCPNGCSFCPSSKNTNKKVHKLALEDTKQKLKMFKEKGYTNIHFTDEDLFRETSWAYEVLSVCKELGGFNLIALGHSGSLVRFVHMYGASFLREAGVRLLEIGFEGGVLLDQKGKKHMEHCLYLQSKCPDLVYWLTMTFAPGETIQTLNETGRFLKRYGMDPAKLVPRLRTNGTEAGLGQFFQQYPDLRNQNLVSLESPWFPTRLSPSYIPWSFLNSRIKEIDISRWEEYKKWCSLYQIPIPYYIFDKGKGNTIFKLLPSSQAVPITQFVDIVDFCIGIAIAARLEMIK